MTRKEVYVKVLATIQTTLNKVMEGEATLDSDTLTNIAKGYGFVEGKRGRDGGYQATNEGVEFVGENLQTFLENEALAKTEAEKAAKQARKEATKATKKELEAQVAAALANAA